MILNVYAVHDKAVGAFMQPFYAPSHGSAIRSFVDAINDQNHQFFKHGPDYTLYTIGSWDDATGVHSPSDPEKLLTGFEARNAGVSP